MQFIQLLENEWILTWIIIFLILFFILGTGRIAPKVVFAGMILLSGICVFNGWTDFDDSLDTTESKARALYLLQEDTIAEVEPMPQQIAKGGDKEVKKPNQIPKPYEEDFGGVISIEGIDDESLKRELIRKIDIDRKSKKALHLEIDHNGSLAVVKGGAVKKYRYSEGELIIRVNGQECCCNGSIIISLDEQEQEAEMTIMNERVADQIRQEIQSNKTFILKTLSACL